MLPHSNKQEQKLIASKISLQYHHILQHRPSTISEQTWMRKTYDCIQMCLCTDHIKKITHTKKLGQAHLRISVWYLLMNLKNNYLLK